MQRKATSKRLRFEVFHRDHFTCQYCGAQPPSVVLVCDHIIPVSKGGLTSAENLTTACEGCNAGKSDKPLGEAIARPDADLMYLNIQQEIAELQRYDQEKERYSLALESAARRIIQDTWFGRFDGDWHPSIRFVSQVIEKYDAHVAEKAIEATAIAFNQGKLKKNGTWFPYTWAVARNTNDELYGKGDEVEDLALHKETFIATLIILSDALEQSLTEEQWIQIHAGKNRFENLASFVPYFDRLIAQYEKRFLETEPLYRAHVEECPL